jgi:23S rRNA pseudouridine1911/1915/1917 synthase
MAVEHLSILFEDNHILAVNKTHHDLVQKDVTGDISLDEKIKQYLKDKYKKPGDVFLGIVHRLDRPVTGAVLFARTSKSLTRLTTMFREGKIKKTYWAIVKNPPENTEGRLVHYMSRNPKQNKSYCHENPGPALKMATLNYRLIARSDKYFLIEVDLETGRHHQIRAQLAHIGCPVKGDLKYGFPRSNHDGGISLHAREIRFEHPVSKVPVIITAETPTDEKLWKAFGNQPYLE